MATIQIDLPDQLAQDAENAGLLSPTLYEQWLQAQLRVQNVAELIHALERMDTINDPEIITLEVAAEEIAAMRSERRAAGLA
jgi:hypothetical protein